VTEPFSWIPQVINSSPELFEYHEHGSQENATINLASLTTNQRISKGQLIDEVIPAVLADIATTQKFSIIEVPYFVSDLEARV